MRVFLLYITTVLIWGTTWISIKLQLGVVELEVSIFYRFGLAVCVLFVALIISRKLQKIDFQDHLFCFIQGACLFCFNFYVLYTATGYITSGLVSIIFSFSTIFNTINNWLWFGVRPTTKITIGSAISLAGITTLFWPQLVESNFDTNLVFGISLAALGTYFFSAGNLVSVRHKKKGLQILSTNVWGMFYGACIILSIVMVRNIPFQFDSSPIYLGSLFFLVVPGTLIVFWTYLSLIAEIGVDRAAYSTVLFPIVALTISTFVEEYVWTTFNVVGLLMVLVGNVFIFSKFPTKTIIPN